jgi:eukaryotic-like serine/threonine-protein kinase
MYIYNGVQAQLSLQKWKPIGSEGKNSKVYVALDPQLNEALVLKEITKASLDEQQIDNYFLEAQILNEANHPHVMPIRFAAQDGDNIYITMPYYSRGSVNTIMDQRQLTVREIIKYSLDFLSGLLFIHIKGMLHLDLKPTNIIINDNDRAILTDFGLARHLNDVGFASQDMQYTLHRSPESYTTNDKTVLDDIYQAGLTLYRMSNGNEVFKDQFKTIAALMNNDRAKIADAVRKGKFPDRKYYLPHIPKKLRKVINLAMHQDPDKRYQNVLDIINALSKIDENLDWEYTHDKEGNIHSWILDEEKSRITITLIKVGEKHKASGMKMTKASGRTTNISKASMEFSNETDAFKFLEDNLSAF